jgi:hypothetical protein
VYFQRPHITICNLKPPSKDFHHHKKKKGKKKNKRAGALQTERKFSSSARAQTPSVTVALNGA